MMTRREFGVGAAAFAGVMALPAEGASRPAAAVGLEPFLRSLHPGELIGLHQQNREAVTYWNSVGDARAAAALKADNLSDCVELWAQASAAHGEQVPFALAETRSQNPLIEAILRDYGLRYDATAERFRRTAP